MLNTKDKILLFGYGKYGESVAKKLRDDEYDVYIVEEDKKNVRRAAIDGFENIITVDIENDEELLNILNDNGFEKVFCAYDNEEKNIYLTITFKAIMPNLEVVAICESKESERKLKLAGAKKIIDTIEIAANRIFFILEKPAVTEAMDNIFYKNPNLTFKEIVVPKNSFLDGVNIDEVDFKKYKIIVIGIVDKELGDKFTFVTKGIKHKIDADDILVVIGYKEDIKNFEKKLSEGKR